MCFLNSRSLCPTASCLWTEHRINTLYVCFQGDDIISLLKTLPPAKAVEIADKMLIWGRLTLEKETDDSEEKVTSMKLTAADNV